MGEYIGMDLHPVLLEKLNAALSPDTAATFTRRDALLPGVPGKVHAVTGMRRSGKTIFLGQLLADRRRTVPAERALYVSFDDERLADMASEDMSRLIEEYYRRYPELRGRETVYWFLDEVQLVKGWERFFRRVIDSERVEVVVSGSSAKMLSREVHTSLRGRGMETVIRPFSFREFLRHRNEEPAKDPRRLTSDERSLVEKRFIVFLAEGGFHEAQGLDAPLRIELLQGYVNTVLFRDIVERYGVSQVAALRWLVRHCCAIRRMRSARTASIRPEGAGARRCQDSCTPFSNILWTPFFFRPCRLRPIRSASVTQIRAIYPADPGLIGAFDTSGRANTGHALETAVLIEIERRRPTSAM